MGMATGGFVMDQNSDGRESSPLSTAYSQPEEGVQGSYRDGGSGGGVEEGSPPRPETLSDE